MPLGQPRRIVVLRHGETTHNLAGIWQGHVDAPLSPLGVRQAEEAGPALAALDPTVILSSDLGRAARTAEAVAAACGLPVHLDPRLREIDVGSWQGLTNAEVTARDPELRAAVLRGEDVPRGGDGERISDVAVRVRGAVDDLLADLGPGGCAVVTTHGAAGRVIVAELLGIDQQLGWRLLGALGNCHWAELAEGRQGWYLRTWNVSAGTPSNPGTQPP